MKLSCFPFLNNMMLWITEQFDCWVAVYSAVDKIANRFEWLTLTWNWHMEKRT